MGLDMYLLKQKKHSILSRKEIDCLMWYVTCKKRGIKEEEIVKNNKTVFNDINKIAGKIEMNINDINTLERYLSPYYAQHIGYWRKANQIHKWFVDNIQDGIDDQRIYEISKEELERLLKMCKDIYPCTFLKVSLILLYLSHRFSGHRYHLEYYPQTTYEFDLPYANTLYVEHNKEISTSLKYLYR